MGLIERGYTPHVRPAATALKMLAAAMIAFRKVRPKVNIIYGQALSRHWLFQTCGATLTIGGAAVVYKAVRQTGTVKGSDQRDLEMDCLSCKKPMY